jgi:AcrR family transcriptional regulator
MENRIHQILGAAAELFFEKGYHATSTRDIAQKVGIQSASIYHHFESKEAILASLLSRTMDDLLEGAQQALMLHSDPGEQLRDAIRRHVLLHGLRPKEATVADTELRGLKGENLRRIIEKRDQYERIIDNVIEFGERGGAFRVRDRKLTVYAIIEMCNQVGYWFKPRGRLSIDEVADVFAELGLRIVGHGRAATTPAMDVAGLRPGDVRREGA